MCAEITTTRNQARALVQRLARELKTMDIFLNEERGTDDSAASNARPFPKHTPNPLFDNLSQSAVSDVLKALSNLRTMRNDLYSFCRMVDDRITDLRKEHETQILNAGMNLLPSEMLSQIFLQACSTDSAGVRFAFTISHVCQKFRAAALRTPAIWATVTNDLPLKWVDLCLARSEPSELTIRINDKTYEGQNTESLQDISDFISVVSLSHHRWMSLVYHEPDHDGFDYDEHNVLMRKQLDMLRAATSNLSFPRLSHLSVTIDSLDLSIEHHTDVVVASWATPRLTYFHGHGLLPSLSFSPSLTICTLDLRIDHFKAGRMLLLLQRLTGLPNLKKLTFRLEIVDEPSEAKLDWTLFTDRPCLPMLEELIIIHERSPNSKRGDRPRNFSAGNEPSGVTLKDMTAYFDLPALVTLSCELLIEGNVFRRFHQMLPDRSRFESLHRLVLKHRRPDSCNLLQQHAANEVDAGPWGLDALLAKVSRVHHLEIDGPELQHFSRSPRSVFERADFKIGARVSVLTLRGSSERFIHEILTFLQLGPCWDRFETLRLKAYKGSVDSLKSIRDVLEGRNLELIE